MMISALMMMADKGSARHEQLLADCNDLDDRIKAARAAKGMNRSRPQTCRSAHKNRDGRKGRSLGIPFKNCPWPGHAAKNARRCANGRGVSQHRDRDIDHDIARLR